VKGYPSAEEMLAREPLEAVAICSPHRFHREHLELALARTLHTLCEKPLVFEEGRNAGNDARRLTAAFAQQRRILMVNEQWPYTLPCFDRIWPGVRQAAAAPHSLTMLLCPAESGLGMIPNALPHVLSLLLTLAPGGGKASNISVLQAEAALLDVRFDYVHPTGTTRVTARFRQVPRQPRPAGYAIDGYGVRRIIAQPDYRMTLEAARCANEEIFWKFVLGEGGKAASCIPLDDPLSLLVGDFVQRARNVEQQEWAPSAIADNARLLGDVFNAAAYGGRSLRE
jgi:hypothetical protein